MRDSDPLMAVVLAMAATAIWIVVALFIALYFLSSRAEARYDPVSTEYNRVGSVPSSSSPSRDILTNHRRNQLAPWWLILPYRWIDPYPLYLRK